MSDFKQIVRARRSAGNFIEGQGVSFQELDEIFERENKASVKYL